MNQLPVRKRRRFASLPTHGKASALLRSFFTVALLGWIVAAPQISRAQDDPDEPEPEPDTPMRVGPTTTGKGAADFGGALQVVHGPSSANTSAKFGIDIFPEASRVHMSVRDTNPVPIERARRGAGWVCAKGGCSAESSPVEKNIEGDAMLRSIKISTPALPVPVTIWRNRKSGAKLDFDPSLLGRRSYAHICAYPPVETDDPKAPRRDPKKVETCKDGEAQPPTSDSADLLLGLEWPHKAELANFKYLAIVDSCGNARVQPFQRSFTVPAFEVVTGGCGKPDGKVLRIFPTGGFLRVTAFNLDGPAMGDVMNVTYRVNVPPLESYSDAEAAKILFPDLRLNDLKIDCGPGLRKNPTDPQGRPKGPGGGSGPALGSLPVWAPANEEEPEPTPKNLKTPVPGEEPPIEEPGDDDASRLVPKAAGATTAAAAPPSGPAPQKPPTGPTPPPGPTPPGAGPGTPGAPAAGPPGSMSNMSKSAPTVPQNEPKPGEPSAKPLDHGSLVIAPEPLMQGNCRLVLSGQTRWRLSAPLALRVSLYRTDKVDGNTNQPINLLTDEQSQWIVTTSDNEFPIPALRNSFDGDSRLKLVVQSDPLNANGKMVLVGDAGRVAAVINDGENEREAADKYARRMIGSVTIHSVPLCGESNFETLEEAGSCVRAYLTIPAMLATIQITRAPWVETPIITRNILTAVGMALAFDSYDPVERRAFPIAGQVGGAIENLGEDRLALMGYVGVAPTLPILGEGGNTTTFGLLGGIGMAYITNAKGPDEGFKPTAFLSIVVQVGQANPAVSGAFSASGSAGFD